MSAESGGATDLKGAHHTHGLESHRMDFCLSCAGNGFRDAQPGPVAEHQCGAVLNKAANMFKESADFLRAEDDGQLVAAFYPWEANGLSKFFATTRAGFPIATE